MALHGPAERSMRLMAARTWRPASIWSPHVWQMAPDAARLITCWIPTNRNSLQSKTNTGTIVRQSFVARKLFLLRGAGAQNSLHHTKSTFSKLPGPDSHICPVPQSNQHLLYSGENNVPMMAFFLAPSPEFTSCFLIRRSLRHMCSLMLPRRPRRNSYSFPAEFRANSSQMRSEQRGVCVGKRCFR